MNRKFSPEVKRVISSSRDSAIRLGHDYIGTEHLLLGIIKDKESLASRVLNSLQVNTSELQQTVERNIRRGGAVKTRLNIDNLPLNKQAEKVLKVTFLEAKMLKSEEITPEHLVLSILKHNDNPASEALNEFEVDYETFKSELEFVMQEQEFSQTDLYAQASDSDDSYEEEDGGGSSKYQRKGNSKSKTPVLDNFGRDITKLAEEDKLDPIIGRETEIERVSQILSRRKKNNPILIGEPGVGKTAIIARSCSLSCRYEI